MRIRLNAPVIRVRHSGDPAAADDVDITYVRDGKLASVRGGACVLGDVRYVSEWASTRGALNLAKPLGRGTTGRRI